MSFNGNVLAEVETYLNSSLPLLVNQNPFINLANKEYLNFQDAPAQLGQTVTFQRPTRYTVADTFVADFQSTQQNFQSLTVNKSKNTSYIFDEFQFRYGADKYMSTFGASAMAALGTKVGIDVASVCLTNTYRCANPTLAPINSYQDYATFLANFRNFGSANEEAVVIMDDLSVPSVVGSGLNQFAMKRNDEIANSWELGTWNRAKFVQSNLLPIHIAGTVGNDPQTLTITSIDSTGTILTMSGASASDADALKKNDILNLSLPGSNPLRFTTYIGYQTSGQNVQVRVQEDAGSSSGGVVVATVYPALIDVLTNPTNSNANINIPATGATVTAVGSHRAGVIYSGRAMYLGMPRLSGVRPFDCASVVDPDTGASLRMYYGAIFGTGQTGFVNDVGYGYTMVDDYAMRIAYPI